MSEKISGFFKNNLNHIVFVFYMIITVLITMFHECWRDEAQAWLIARDLSFIDIIKQMQYEGHPCLWHLILAPFAKLGLPFYTISIINLIFMYASAWLVLYKTKIRKLIKLLFLFTSPMLYFYPVFARCYSLMCFLVILISILYKSRRKYPVIFAILLLLLTNTHVIMAGFVGMVLLTYYMNDIFVRRIKDKKVIIGFFIVIFGFILLFLQLYSSLDECKLLSNVQNMEYLSNFMNLLYKFIEFFYLIMGLFYLSSDFVFWLNVIISLIIVYIIFKIPKEKNSEILIFWFSTIFILFVNIVIYCNSPQRTGIVLLLLLFLCINYKGKKITIIEKVCILIFSFSIIAMLQSVYMEIIYENSYAKNTAEFITENCDENSIFVSNTPDMNLAIIGYLDADTKIKFYNLKTDIYHTYITWDYDVSTDIKIEDIKNKIQKLGIKENIYYICSNENYGVKNNMKMIINKLVEEGYFKKIYYSGNNILTDETYEIYQINGMNYYN